MQGNSLGKRITGKDCSRKAFTCLEKLAQVHPPGTEFSPTALGLIPCPYPFYS